MRKLVIAIISLFCCTAQGQVCIDGRHVFVDSLTNTLLATIPEHLFGGDATLTIAIEPGCQEMVINGTTVVSSSSSDADTESSATATYTFCNISAEQTWPVALSFGNNKKQEMSLQFTFLPVVQLNGSFNSDYQEGTFIFVCPDSAQTDTLTARIKWRGGSTNKPTKHKHNYKVKFDEDHTFLGMRNDNNWILDAGQADIFRLRNRIAMNLWNDFNSKPYYADQEPKARIGVSGQVVELFLNGKYHGIYNFSENLDRKQTKVKKVDKTTGDIRGCLYKVKNYGYGNMNDTVDIYDNHSETWNVIEAKYPDLEDADTTDWSTLYNAINFVVFSSDEEFAEQVSDYFDLPVVVDISVFIATMGALDNRGKNILWAVHDKTQDKKLTPMPWDLDGTVGQEWMPDEYRIPEVLFDWQIGLTNRLTRNNVQGFNDLLNQRYKELRQGLLTTDSLIGRYVSYYQLLTNSGAARRETDRWNHDSDVRGMEINFDATLDSISNWLTVHMQWMDGAWFPLDYWYEWYESQLEGIATPLFTRRQEGVYTLGGQRLGDGQPLSPGIYIRNGRKVVVR